MSKKRRIQPVVLCGGSGTRLWPVSRPEFPKQFLTFQGERSLLEDTLLRAMAMPNAANPICIAAARHEHLVQNALTRVDCNGFLLLEPEARNTAPAIAASALFSASRDDDAILFVMPADHIVEGIETFTRSVETAIELAEADWITILGIVPHDPSSAFGYIVPGEKLADQCFKVANFCEKPSPDTAARLIADGAFWNAGMVVASASAVLAALRQHEPQLLSASEKALAAGTRKQNRIALARDEFMQARKISFDHAVLEHHDRVAVTPLTASWRDVGTWGEVASLFSPDESGNSAKGDVRFVASRDNFIFAPRRRVVTLGVDNLAVIDSADGLLVAQRGHLTLLGKVVEELPVQSLSDVEILLSGDCVVRKFALGPGEASTKDSNEDGTGYWIITVGRAKVMIGTREFQLLAHESATFRRGESRLIANAGDSILEYIEIKTRSGH